MEASLAAQGFKASQQENTNVPSITTQSLKTKKSVHVCCAGVRDVCARKVSPGAFSSSSKSILSSEPARAGHWFGAGTGHCWYETAASSNEILAHLLPCSTSPRYPSEYLISPLLGAWRSHTSTFYTQPGAWQKRDLLRVTSS